MNLTVKLSIVFAAATIVLSSGLAGAAMLIVPNVDSGGENLRVDSLGAATSLNVGFGNYVVGPAGVAAQWARPIVQFPASSFSSIAGETILSATLHYGIVSDFLEPGETGSSEVRIFSTDETDLTTTNMNIFAALSGDGGAHTPIGTAPWSAGVTGPQSILFSPAGLVGLYNAINSGDDTVAFAFREFSVVGIGADVLDEVVLGVPPGNLRLEIKATPEPSVLTLLGLGSLAILRRRRRA